MSDSKVTVTARARVLSGLDVGQTAEVVRTPIIDALIAKGHLAVDSEADEPEHLPVPAEQTEDALAPTFAQATGGGWYALGDDDGNTFGKVRGRDNVPSYVEDVREED